MKPFGRRCVIRRMVDYVAKDEIIYVSCIYVHIYAYTANVRICVYTTYPVKDRTLPSALIKSYKSCYNIASYIHFIIFRRCIIRFHFFSIPGLVIYINTTRRLNIFRMFILVHCKKRIILFDHIRGQKYQSPLF